MPSLNAFLTTGKNKRIATLRNVCSTFGLETEGKTDVLRKRIVSYVNGDEEKEMKVKALVTSHVENNCVSNPQSQDDLFTQDNYRTTVCSDDENEDVDDAIHVIESSFASMSMTDQPVIPEATVLNQLPSYSDKTDQVYKNLAPTIKHPPCCNHEKLIALKDAQIETLEHCLSVKEGQLTRMEDLSQVLMNKLDSAASFFTLKTDEFLTHAKRQDDLASETLKEVVNKIKEPLIHPATTLPPTTNPLPRLATHCQGTASTTANNSTNNNTKNNSINNGKNKNINNSARNHSTHVTAPKEPTQNSSTPPTTINNTNVSSINNSGNRNTNNNSNNHSSHLTTPKRPTRNGRVLFVHDYIGTDLNPHQLKPGTRVIAAKRSTLEEATEKTGKIENKDEIEDIVYVVGNDNLAKNDTPDQMQDKAQKMFFTFNEKYPNARMHMTGVIPLDNTQHHETNQALHKLCKHTGSNFITTKPFLDKTTKKIRHNTLNNKGNRLNEWGVRIIAKEIKKSLYSTANRGSNKLTELRTQQQQQTTPPPETSPSLEASNPPVNETNTPPTVNNPPPTETNQNEDQTEDQPT